VLREDVGGLHRTGTRHASPAPDFRANPRYAHPAVPVKPAQLTATAASTGHRAQLAFAPLAAHHMTLPVSRTHCFSNALFLERTGKGSPRLWIAVPGAGGPRDPR
jgi:hypothetical protein